MNAPVQAPAPAAATGASPAPVVPALPFTARWLLAPMEGVTAPSFRDLVLARHAPTDLGGAFTEFVRVIQGPVAHKELHKHLGTARFPIPVGVQLMGRDLEGSRARCATPSTSASPWSTSTSAAPPAAPSRAARAQLP